MVLGVLSTLSSTIFTIINRPYNAIPIVLFWGLLSGFEFLFAWIWLLSKPQLIQRPQKITLIILFAMSLGWIALALMNADSKSIFTWALRTINYSGLYFIGMIIYYRASNN